MLNFAGTALQAVLNALLLFQCVQTARLPDAKKIELQIHDPFEPAKANS